MSFESDMARVARLEAEAERLRGDVETLRAADSDVRELDRQWSIRYRADLTGLVRACRERDEADAYADEERRKVAALQARIGAALGEHYEDSGCCVSCVDEYDNPASWPCPTSAALGVDPQKEAAAMSEPCMVCEGTNNGMLWHAQQPLWDAVVGRHSGLMCPPCFTAAASALGYLVSWTPMVTRSPGEVGGNSNHWHNETRDWLLMGQLDPEYPDRSEHPVWAVIRDALEAAGYPQPPMDYYPPENFALSSRANTDAGYHKLDRLARERAAGVDPQKDRKPE